MTIKFWSDIKNVLYINLQHRTDRKKHMEAELCKIGLHGNRFDAIEKEKGSIGCALSHIACLKIAIVNNYDHILICEDDITFLNPELFISQFNKFLETHFNWDVIIISGNNVGNFKSIDETSIKVNKCQSTTGYLVNGHYFQTLLNNFEQSLTSDYPIDLWWWELQRKDNFYLIIPLTIVQRKDYSDIEKKYVDYIDQMLDIKYVCEN